MGFTYKGKRKVSRIIDNFIRIHKANNVNVVLEIYRFMYQIMMCPTYMIFTKDGNFKPLLPKKIYEYYTYKRLTHDEFRHAELPPITCMSRYESMPYAPLNTEECSNEQENQEET